jgi:hypothetical protein
MKRVGVQFLSLVSLAALVFAGLILPGFAQAQTTKPKPASPAAPVVAPAPPRLYQVSVIRVKPDMVNEWTELIKNTAIPALKKAGVKERACWQTAQFGESYEFVFLTPLESFAQLDEEGPMLKALGEQGYRSYLEKARRMVVSMRTYADQDREDLSYAGNMSLPPKLAVVATVTVAPGRTADFENLLKTDVLPAVKKGEAKAYFVSQTLLGGDISQYTTVTLYDSFADIGKGSPILRGMGGQAGYERFLRKTAGIVVRTERAVYRYNTELSFGLEPGSK